MVLSLHRGPGSTPGLIRYVNSLSVIDKCNEPPSSILQPEMNREYDEQTGNQSCLRQ